MKKNNQSQYEGAFSWEHQANHYPQKGEGILYLKANLNEAKWIDCLLFYGADKTLEGILNYYPFDFPPFEEKGNVNIQVKPNRRRLGIGTKLLDQAIKRFDINLKPQRYTPDGEKFIEEYLKKNKPENYGIWKKNTGPQ